MARKPRKPVQRDLFGEPIEERRPSGKTDIVPLPFKGNTVRMLMIKGKPWWVLNDLARVLGYQRPRDAGRILRDNHKGAHRMRSPGGVQEMTIVNEAGLYRLMMRSDHPNAAEFQDWITDEVLPTIRRTGTYSLKPRGRVAREAKRLGCDPETAKVRCEQFETNKSLRDKILARRGCVNDIVSVHETGYKEQFGATAAELREALGLRPWETPLDRMELVPLSINQHAKALASKIIKLSEEEGRPIPPSDQARLVGLTMKEVKEHALGQIGEGSTFKLVDDPRRGTVIDVVRPSLN
jgi:prophage antirepressor-like protein